MTRQPRSLVVTLVLALAGSTSAVAAPPRPEPVDLGEIEVPPEAARHNADGMKAYEAGDYEAAYAAFKRSHMSMVRIPLDLGACSAGIWAVVPDHLGASERSDGLSGRSWATSARRSVWGWG